MGMRRSFPRYRFSGAKAARLIERAGLTQVLTSSALEVGTNAVWRWMNDRAEPTVGNLMRLSLLLECKMEDLVERER